jgi:RES domain-containing protein
VTAGVSLKLTRVLDLTIGQVRKKLRVARHRMVTASHSSAPVESVTQAIGRLSWSECYQALLVPSAVNQHATNIVVFPEKLLPGQIVPYNPDQLPPEQSPTLT